MFSVLAITFADAFIPAQGYNQNREKQFIMQPYTRLNEELASYFSKGKLVKYSKGEFVLHAGKEPPGVFMIQRGFIKVYSISEEGTENVHLIYKAGEVFPLIWTFKSVARNVFYQALSPSRLWLLQTEELKKLVSESHGASQAIINQLTNQFHILADRIENLQYGDALYRVAYRLIFLSERFGVKEGKKISIDVPITHQIIADTINLARETVSRQIEELEKRKLVSHRGRKIVIEDLAKLQRLINKG